MFGDAGESQTAATDSEFPGLHVTLQQASAFQNQQALHFGLRYEGDHDLEFGSVQLDSPLFEPAEAAQRDGVIRGGSAGVSSGSTALERKEEAMKANVSSILLGVEDLERSKKFYGEGLGWTVLHDYGVSVFYESDTDTRVGFYGRDGLAGMVGLDPAGSGFGGVVLTYVVRTEERVDEILTEAEQAGATILKPAAALQWGGYGGTFADPDGHIWDVGFSAKGKDQPYAE